MLMTRLAGKAIGLHPSGAAFLPEYRTLLVADAHFGKAVHFRTPLHQFQSVPSCCRRFTGR
jgi:metallophosphoesterase superfamily enzyme